MYLNKLCRAICCENQDNQANQDNTNRHFMVTANYLRHSYQFDFGLQNLSIEWKPPKSSLIL